LIINIIDRVAKRENITLIKTVNKFLKSFEYHFLNWGQEFAVKVLWFSHTTLIATNLNLMKIREDSYYSQSNIQHSKFTIRIPISDYLTSIYLILGLGFIQRINIHVCLLIADFNRV
jgi:hypothetical protein